MIICSRKITFEYLKQRFQEMWNDLRKSLLNQKEIEENELY